MSTKKYLRPNGTYFEFTGNLNKKLVVFTHGFGLNYQMWQWLPLTVYNKFDILKYDLYGHGKSVAPPYPPSLELFAKQLAELINYLGYEKAILVGFSLGGMIIRKFVNIFENNVEGLIILNSPHKRNPEQQISIETRVKQAADQGPKSTVDDAIQRWFSDEYISKNQEKVQLIKNWILNNNPTLYSKIYKVLAQDVNEIINPEKKISCPTLVVTGDKDFGNNPDMSKRICDECLNSKLVIMKNLKHMGLVEDSIQFGKILESFLNQFLEIEKKII